jgi:hypothetical protein
VSLSDIRFTSLLGPGRNVFLGINGYLACNIMSVSYLDAMFNGFLESGRYNNGKVVVKATLRGVTRCSMALNGGGSLEY